MSYGRITHPSEFLHVGQEVTVKVLKFDRSKERVSLGIKQLEPDPWETVADRYPVNGRVIGRVVNVTGASAAVARAFRQNAMARPGAAAYAIRGADDDTASTATVTAARRSANARVFGRD